MATHGLLWMDARSEMRDNALFYLKKLWGFLDMPDGPVIGEMLVLQKKCRRKHLT